VFLCVLSALLMIHTAGVTRLQGQAATATVLGTVTDSSGAAIPDAAVQAKNNGTGATQTSKSDSQGRFGLSNLGVGDYEIQASKQGFSTAVRTGVTLTVGSQSVIDFSLAVGQQSQTVTVQAETSQVETTNATVGTLVGQQQMRELPLNGRNFEQLIVLTPGVQTIAGNAFQATGFQGRAPEYSFAGSRPTGQAILLDDENLQNFWSKGMGSVMGTSLGVEAIGEFQTLTNTYSAQFGGNGAVVNAVSRSGTNAVHGSAYEFFRNDVLDARSFFDPHTIPTYRQNQFGGSVGGPIKKDKMFFFANYEGVRLAQGESKISFVPGCNLPQFAANCNPAAGVSAAVATAVRNTLAVFPAANLVVGGRPEALTVANRTGNENYVLARFDWVISEKNSFLARYISDKSSFVEPYGGGGFAGGPIANWPEQDSSHTQFATVEWRRIVSPTLVNVARFSFSRPGTYEFQNPTEPGGLVNGADPLQFAPVSSGRPDGIVAIGGLSGIGSALQLPFNTTQNRFTEADDVTWTHGAHSVRFGASVSRLQSNTFMPFFDGGQFSFSNLAQFVTGKPNVALYVPLGSYPNRDFPG
jgi:Carboxypeptidase regulatory-like domain